LPSPEALFSTRRPSRSASVVSASSSLFSRTSSRTAETSEISHTSNIRVGPHGLARQLHPARRRAARDPSSHDQADPVSPNDRMNFDNASKLFVAILLNKNAWPSTKEKNLLVEEAIEDSNNTATRERRATSVFLPSGRAKVSLCLNLTI